MKRHQPPDWLALPLCLLASALIGCDSADDAGALDGPEDAAALAVAAPADLARPDAHDGDECFDAAPLPLDAGWIARDGDLPAVEVRVADELAAARQIEVQFLGTWLPVEPGPAQEFGRPRPVRDGEQVALPDELVAAMRRGEAVVAYGMVRACDERGEPWCEIRNSGPIYIEDGQAFLPDDYAAHLRGKWSSTRPWLFEGVTVTAIVDMKGE